MGKIIRRVIAVLLTVTAIIIAVLPAQSAEAISQVHGDYTFDGYSLIKYHGNDAQVTVPNWVHEISEEAFANCDTLERLILPDSVTSINHAAFQDCKNLAEVVLPNSVKTIGSSAFSGCTSLYSIDIPEKTELISPGAFADCPSLSTISIDANNKSYTCNDGVIYSKDGKELVQYLAGRPKSTYNMPSTVEQIDEYAFWGSNELEKVNISNNVNSIPEYAFSNCKGLNKISLPMSVERINAFSFEDCSNLEYINIPESVGYIDERAFLMTDHSIIRLVDDNGDVIREISTDNTKAYASNDGNNAGNNSEDSESDESSDSNPGNQVSARTQSSRHFSENPNQSSTETTDENNTDDTYNGSFSGDSNWVSEITNTDYKENTSNGELGSTKVVDGSAMVTIPNNTVVNEGYDLIKAENEDDLAASSGRKNTSDSENIIVGETYSGYKGSDKKVTVPDGITTIGNRAFYQNDSLNEVNLPDSTETIDDFAFARTPIRSISIPSNVKNIGYGSFYNCNYLTDVSIPSNLENIELGAFDGTRWLDDFYNSEDNNDFLIVGDGILLAYKGENPDVIIPDNVKKIAAGAFSNNQNIVNVVMPDGLYDIGEDAFNNCKNLKQVKFNDDLEYIDDRAFKDTALSVINIPASVLGLGLGAFDTKKNDSLKTIIFSGETLPQISYNSTATRLSADDLRTKVFEGVDNIIIPTGCDLNNSAILNPEFYGFNGQVYTVADSGVNKTLKLEQCTSMPDNNGNIVIDPHVKIGYDDYIMADVDSSAFNHYKEWSKWSDVKPQKIIVNGNSSEELNNLLQSVTDSLDSVQDNNSGIRVSVTGSCFGNNNMGQASLTNSTDSFTLNISQDNKDKDALDEAYYALKGSYPGSNSVYLSLDLYDKTGTIPIHKLGDNKLEVSIPVPTSMIGAQNVNIACISDNGELTELSSQVTEYNGIEVLNFVTAHCSPYIIYCKLLFNPENIEYTVNTNEENMTDTGFGNTVMNVLSKQVIKGLEIKWLVVIILVSLSIILALYQPDKKKKKN